jgi:WD40 repeat protein
VAWAPDGRSLATLGGDALDDCRIEIWDTSTLKKTQTLTGSRIKFRNTAALAWSPDGHSLACAAREIQVWNLAAPGAPRSLSQSGRTGDEAEQLFLEWSPDSGSLAALECRQTMGHEAILTGWDLKSGRQRFSWKRPYEFSYLRTPIAWSPDGKRFAWGGPKPGVWNVSASTEEFPIAGHAAPVVDVAWSADGSRMISRAEIFGGFRPNFELKVWDAIERQEILMLRGPMAGWSVAPGFAALASRPGRGSDPGDVLVWDLIPRN